MDMAAILQEIDAEIEKLERVREIIAGLYRPVRRRKKRPKRTPPVPAATARAEPKLVVVPPRTKREYRTRVKATTQIAGALAAPVSYSPVFVPRAISLDLPVREPKLNELDPTALEAAMRQNLLSGADQRF